MLVYISSILIYILLVFKFLKIVPLPQTFYFLLDFENFLDENSFLKKRAKVTLWNIFCAKKSIYNMQVFLPAYIRNGKIDK